MKICFLGQGKEICVIGDKLLQENHEIVGILTYPKEDHMADSLEHKFEKKQNVYSSIFNYSVYNKIPLHESSNFNLPETIKWVKDKKPELLISWRNRSILKHDFLSLFEKKIINIHIGKLPEYRGSGAMSWMILNNEIETAVTYHFIDKGIDSGEIITQVPFKINKGSYPIDIYKIASDTIINTCSEVVEIFKKGTISFEKQNEVNSTCFPRLRTIEDGKIDFNSSASEIERMVRAFGWPYAGAFAFNKEKKIHFGRVMVLQSEKLFHSYTNGLVVSKDPIKGSITIIAGGEKLEVLTIRSGNEEIPAQQVLKIGMRIL